MTSTAVTTGTQRSTAVTISTDEQLRDFLQERAGEFSALAKSAGVSPEHLVAELVVCARKKPEILKCTPDSILNFMYDAAKAGLVIGRGCFPVPVRDNKAGVVKLECWIGYKGMTELVVYGRGAKSVFANAVYEGETFVETGGLYPNIEHHIDHAKRGNPANITHVYAVAVINSMTRKFRVLSRAEVEKYRKLNKSDTTKPGSPWVENYETMAKAKAILRLLSDMPSNPRLAHALNVIERTEGGLDPALEIAAPAPDSPPAPGTPAAMAPVASAFEEAAPSSRGVTLPNWTARPELAGKQLKDVAQADLERLFVELRDNAAERYKDLIEHIAVELEYRREHTT